MKNTIKKILLAMAVVPLMVSLAFGAATPPYEVPVVNSDIVTTVQCPVLASDVTIGMSSGVFGAISCDELSGSVKVGTCSKGGSTSARSIACKVVTAKDSIAVGNPAADIYNDGTCNGTTVLKFNSVGRTYFSMSTDGGSPAETPLNPSGDSVCDAASVLAKIKR